MVGVGRSQQIHRGLVHKSPTVLSRYDEIIDTDDSRESKYRWLLRPRRRNMRVAVTGVIPPSKNPASRCSMAERTVPYGAHAYCRSDRLAKRRGFSTHQRLDGIRSCFAYVARIVTGRRAKSIASQRGVSNGYLLSS